MEYKVFEGSEKNVWKYVFDFKDGAVTEAVLYKYESFENPKISFLYSLKGGKEVK